MSNAYAELFAALRPELALTLGALVVLGLDLVRGTRRTDAQRLHIAVVLGLLWTAVAAYAVWSAGVRGALFHETFRLDALGRMARLGVLLLSFLTLALAPGAARLRNPAEFVALVLLATAGFSLMAVAQQLLVVFLAIELASLSLYLLTGFDKTRPESAEAALKYFLFGGMAAAFLLFGFSLLYGLTGSIALPEIATVLAGIDTNQPLLLIALVMVVAAFGFKAAAAPFHLWAPDVYQGAPSISAALIASASKLAGLTVFARLLWPGLGSASGAATLGAHGAGWLPILALVAAASIVLGNIGALAQSNFRRLLAYSAIAHAGIMLLGVMVADRAGYGPMIYYAITYGLATIGAFGVVGVLERAGVGGSLRDLSGLHRRAPFLAAALFICLLSLAGVPPLAGFFGKFGVFVAAFQSGGIGSATGALAVLGVAASAVGLYYYLVALKYALVGAPVTPDDEPATVPVGAGTRLVLVLISLALLALGLAPTLILSRL